MKKLAALMTIVFVSGAAAKAGDLENLKNSSDSTLSSIQDSVADLTKALPRPGFQPNGGHNPGHNNPPPPGHNPGHVTPPPQPWHPGHNNPPPPPPPGPWHPGPVNPHPVPPPPPPTPWNPNPWGPYPNPHPGPFPPPNPGPWNPGPIPPYYHNDEIRFESGSFDWASDARKSFDEAVYALNRANVRLLEQRLDYSSYRLVFETRNHARVERYNSMQYSWASDAERAANDLAASYAARGLVVLEKNIHRDFFTLSYFDPR